MTKYKCTRETILNHELMKDGTISNNYFTIEKGSEWLWKKEKGEQITIINKHLIEVTLRRCDFVKRFERVTV